MINGIVTTFTSKYSQFTIMGQTMMTNFISGIRTGDASARSAFVTIPYVEADNPAGGVTVTIAG